MAVGGKGRQLLLLLLLAAVPQSEGYRMTTLRGGHGFLLALILMATDNMLRPAFSLDMEIITPPTFSPTNRDGNSPTVLHPLYDESKELKQSRLSCNAAYSAPCARTNAEWLATKAAMDLCEAIDDHSITKEEAWQVITDGRYNVDTNFYPFVMEKETGLFVAHGTGPTLVGYSLKDAVAAVKIGFFDVDHLLDKLVKTADEGGGWVEYFWGGQGVVFMKSSFVTNITDGYLIGVGYHNTPLPRQLPCNADYDSWCSIANARSLVGQAQFLLSGAETLNQFEKSAYELSFDQDEYTIMGGFYIFMYNYDGRLVSHAHLHEQFGMTIGDIFLLKNLGTHEDGMRVHEEMIRAADGLNGGWIQYLWRNPWHDTPFTKVAYIIKIEFQGEKYYLGVGFTHRSLAHDFVEVPRKPLPDSESVTGQGDEDESGTAHSHSGMDGTQAPDATGGTPGTPGGALVPIAQPLSGEFSVGDGMPPSNGPKPLFGNGTTSLHLHLASENNFTGSCTDRYNLPCSFRVSLELSSHVMTHVMSSPLPKSTIWREISHHPAFKSNDFYVYAYDFNMTLVAHGKYPESVGMSMQQIYDIAGLEDDPKPVHRQFKNVALGGGGWVTYDWLVPGTTDQVTAKIAYLWLMRMGGRSYYGGIGFYDKRPPVAEFAETGTRKNGDPILCSSKYALECSETNAKAIVGEAAAELTLVSTELKVRVTQKAQQYYTVEDVLAAINNQDQAFTVNDFTVSVFSIHSGMCPNGDDNSGCCLAHGSNPSYVNRTWQDILDIENITSISGRHLHLQLGIEAGRKNGFYDYSYSGSVGKAQTKRAIVSKITCEKDDLYVVAEYFGTPQPATCDSCPEKYECTEPAQEYCKLSKPKTASSMIGLVTALLVLFLSLALIYWYKHRNWKKRQVLAQKIKQMENQMKDMVEIVHDTGMQIMTADDYRDQFGHVGVGVEKALPPKIQIVWYWEESDRHISRHHSSRVMTGAHFVQYLDVSSDQIERAYQRWKEGKGFKEFRLDLTGKINKPDSQASGAQYVIDFEEMTQRNVWSTYTRAIRREQHVQAPVDLEVVNRLPPLPVDVDFFSKDGEDFLPTYPGQVIQVSKEHPSEQWLYGSVLYDPLLADAQNSQGVGATEGLNRVLAMALHDRPTSGWFPAALSKPADVKVMQNLVESLGGEGVTNLKPPGRWKPQKEGCISVEQGSAEYEEVVHYFLAALYEQRDHVSVVGVQRVQCMPLWQSYAVKKETMRTRDAKNPDHLVNNHSGTVERRWLFHGTTAEVIPKVVKQGFNRAFAGRNAVAFGKGVYFARDAAYSSHASYSTPDSSGIQRMFLCRVAVGDWCRGNNGQLTPDPKPRNPLELFDTTVDEETDPTIFVVYHDAQAYPDYLVSFRRHDEENK